MAKKTSNAYLSKKPIPYKTCPKCDKEALYRYRRDYLANGTIVDNYECWLCGHKAIKKKVY